MMACRNVRSSGQTLGTVIWSLIWSRSWSHIWSRDVVLLRLFEA